MQLAVNLVNPESDKYQFLNSINLCMSIREIFPIDKWDFKSESILNDLPVEDSVLLMKHKSEQIYKKGEIVFREGALPSGIFFIVEGKVKKYKLDQDGREQII